MSTCKASIVVILACLLLGWHAEVRAQEPSSDRIIELIPSLDTQNTSLRTLWIRGRSGNEKSGVPAYNFEVRYKSPEMFSFCISDTIDGTPIVFYSGGQMLVYSPFEPVVYYSANASFNLKLALTNDRLDFRIDYLLRSSHLPIVAVDLPSLLSLKRETIKTTVEIRKDDDGEKTKATYKIFRQMDPQVILRFEIEDSNTPFVNQLEFEYRKTILLTFHEIRWNSALPDDSFIFPNRDVLESIVPLSDVTDEIAKEKINSIVESVGKTLRFLSIKNGRNPLKGEQEEMSKEAHLGKVLKNHVRYGEVLKSTVGWLRVSR